MKRKIRKDRLGEYIVETKTKKGKPLTIMYFAKCPTCNCLVRFTGSLKTRRKTLLNDKTTQCPNPYCNKSQCWKEYPEPIHEDFIETDFNYKMKPSWMDAYM